MKNKSKNLNNRDGSTFLLAGACFVTLYFNSKIQDPFNSPKFWLLLISASWVSGIFIIKFRKFKSIQVKRNFLVIVSIFIFFNFLAALMTDIKLIGFFGETQRKTGFLTYLSLALLALASSSIINNFNLRKIFNWALITGFLLAIYGLMQTSGIDFVQWNNPYNSIISTVGNPNFAAAIMAMMATILIGLIMSPEFSKLIRCFAGITFMMLLFAIYLSEARQGLISLALGGAFIVGFKIYQHNKKYGILSFATFTILGLISILGSTLYLNNTLM